MPSAPPTANAEVKLPACSFVLPCLNEAHGLRKVLARIEMLRPHFDRLDVIVCDNGSADESVSVAQELGARVVHCQQRGYGAAVRTGILAAHFELVVFADSDDTYDWLDAPNLVRRLVEHSADLIVGSRLRGQIEPAAMPPLHRHVGTPALSVLITLLYGLRRGVRVSDCNGGMRALRKSAFSTWNVRSPGMEFASEMIVRALKADAKYREVPIRYRCSQPGRRPHLRPWRDGWRHLRQIFFA